MSIARHTTYLLVLCAGASLGLYVAALRIVRDIREARPSYAWEIFDWIRELPRWREDEGVLHAGAAVPMLLTLLALFSIYGLAVLLIDRRSSTRLTAIIFVAGGLFLLVQLFGASLLSNDVYSYITYGRIFGVYGESPYAVAQIEFRGDPYVRLVEWRNTLSPYGPLWTLLSAGLALIGGERMGLSVMLFRLVSIVASLATAGLVWSCLRKLAPERANQGLALFLWNPLVIFEGGLSAHGDILIAAFLALACWLHLGGRRTLAVVTLVFAALVKFVSGIILPLYVLLLLRESPTWRDRFRVLATSGGAALIAIAIVSGPAGVRPDAPIVHALTSEGGRYANSVHELALMSLRLHYGESPAVVRAPWQRSEWIRIPAKRGEANREIYERASDTLRMLTWPLFAGVYLIAAWRSASFVSFLLASTAVLLAFYWLVAPQIYPWYVIWALALAALIPTSRVAQLAFVLSATMMSLYITDGFDSSSRLWWVGAYRSLFVFVLPFILLGAFELVQTARTRLRAIYATPAARESPAGLALPAAVQVESARPE